MSNRLLKTVTLLAFTAFSTLALADDPPARVGRVALAQGQVSIRSDGQPPSAALVNWPVTSDQTISTAAGARTELRIGSTSVRLDGASALEVVELDDGHLRLHLHYGSASIRVVNPEALDGFELTTPQARVRLREPGRVRVDTERMRDTSVVNVFDGEALVEGGGEQLAVRAGRRAELREDDVRTAQAVRDGFDDWSYGRDQYEDSARSARYVTPEMTGYEDLDRYGSWHADAEYGDLWIPSVGSDWVPYRDGSWVWLEPWGWTWVDSAPWGYAPFHYGRWVHVNHRWAWAPGHRRERHPVWSPALVGWVGGANWSVGFGGRPQPAQGWYPLSPHERFVPTWHASEQHLRAWNSDVRPDGRRGNEHRREGMTVVPHGSFGQHAQIAVSKALRASLPPMAAVQAPAAAPPAPRDGHDQRREDGHGRFDHDHNRGERGQFDHGQRPPLAMPAPVRSAQPPAAPAPHQAAETRPAQRPPTILTAPSVPQAQPGPWQRGGRLEREAFEEARRQQEGRQREPAARPAMAQPAPLQTAPAPNPAEAGFAQHGGHAQRAEGEQRREGDGERHWRERGPAFEQRAMPPQAPPALIPQPPQSPHALIPQPPQSPHALIPQPPQAQHALNPIPETARPLPLPPQAIARPAPPAGVAPAPAAEHHGPHGDEHGRGRGDRNERQQDR